MEDKLNQQPRSATAYISLNSPVTWTATSSRVAWPDQGVAITARGPLGEQTLSVTRLDGNGMIAVWELSEETVSTLEGFTEWKIQVNDGWPLMAGPLVWLSGFSGVQSTQSLGTVIVGPQGRVGVSAYAAAVSGGYSGTAEEWAAGLAAQRMEAIAAADRAEAAENRARGMVMSSVRASYDPTADDEILTLSIPTGMLDPLDPLILLLPVEV